MTGCNGRKCACRLWANCSTYIDKQRQEWRLKKKEYDFAGYYERFGVDWAMPDSVGNG